jgi:hypothetical protein
MHTLDHTKPEAELRVGQAQVEASTNLALDQGKPRCITPNLDFYFLINIFMLRMNVH